MSAPAPQAPAAHDVPSIAAGLRLQWEPVQSAHVLLYPEGMVRLNGSAGEILVRCDGARSVDAIVHELIGAFTVDGVAPDLQADVLAFLALARERGWVRW